MEFILSFILLQILEQMGAVELFSMKKTNKPSLFSPVAVCEIGNLNKFLQNCVPRGVNLFENIRKRSAAGQVRQRIEHLLQAARGGASAAGRIYRREAVREGLHPAVHLSQHHRSLISRVCDETLTGGLIYLAT